MINDSIRSVIENIPFPMWVKGTDGKFIFVNEKFKQIYKLKQHKDFDIDEHKCSDCSIKLLCEHIFKKVIETKQSQSFEVSINSVYNKCYINPYIDENNNLIGAMGVLIDITEIKFKERQFEERESILRTIIDTLPQYIFYKDKNCRYVGYNKKWREYYNSRGIHSMIGKNDFEAGAIPKDLAKIFMQEDKATMNSKKINVTQRKILDKNGKNIIEETVKVPVLSDDGKVWGIVGLASDVTERIEVKEKLIKLSYTDSLTGVYNRACFEEKKEELNKKEYLPIGIIMGDVNGLKVVNDTFGHLQGDKLLLEMSNILRKATSKRDFIFRWGGDEFVILIPNCDENRCENVISKIINECEKSKFNLIEMSIALGSAIKYDVDEDIYDNLQEAEEKLYRQKFLNTRSIRSSMIFSLNQSLYEKNVETQQHTQRLVNYAIKIGKKLGFTTAQLNELELVTKLHDIGKIGISEEILLKPSKLTEEEYNIIKSHTEKGYRILQASSELSHVARGVLTHHERYDGKGYPLGLKGDEIPIVSRIVNIVDSYDAMITNRGYNDVKTKEEAIQELIMCKGGQFDPKITDLFISILNEE